MLTPDEITQLIEAGHLPPQAAGGGDYGAGTASPAAPPAQVAPTRTVTPLSGADLLERRVAAPTPPAPSVSVPAGSRRPHLRSTQTHFFLCPLPLSREPSMVLMQ